MIVHDHLSKNELNHPILSFMTLRRLLIMFKSYCNYTCVECGIYDHTLIETLFNYFNSNSFKNMTDHEFFEKYDLRKKCLH